MKRKFKFFGVCALYCALVLSLFSCAKDFQSDIDELRADVASLQAAINAGKLIKQVNTTATGYELVFTDNSTIAINHGTNGTPGTPGQDGTPGTPGQNGFTPIIGIDADGYWTVIASQGAAATRILDANNQPVKASLQDNLTLVDGFLAVNGVKTTVAIPQIAYNAVERVLMVWIVENDTLTLYKVALAEDVVLTSDIVSIVAPVANTKVYLGFGSVTNENSNTTLKNEGRAWANVTAGQKLGGEGLLPLIINPAAAAIAGYEFEIINANGVVFPIQGTIQAGYNTSLTFSQYAASSTTNGLYSIALNPTIAQIDAFVGTAASKEATELAIRATKGTREIVSGYQYSIKVERAAEVVIPAATTPNYEPIGTSFDALSYFAGIDATDFYKEGVELNTAQEDIAPYITTNLANTTVSTATGNHTVANLNGRTANFTLRTMDYTGMYKKTAFAVTFYTDLTASVPDAAAINHTLTTTAANQDVIITLDPMFFALDAVGKTQLWRDNAVNLDVTGLPAGVTYTFLQGDGITPATGASDVRKIKFNFNPAIAMPTASTVNATFEFDDTRIINAPFLPAAKFGVFTFDIPINISNPSYATAIADIEHKPAVWESATSLKVYGPIAGQLTDPVNYDLQNAYNGLPAADKFAFTSTTTNVIEANQVDYRVTAANMYVAREVKLWYYVFGESVNANNKVLVETFNVTALSEIKEGDVVKANANVDMEITHGNATVLNVKDFFVAKDYLAHDLKAFATTVSGDRDARITNVVVKNISPLNHLLTVVSDYTTGTYTVKSSQSIHELPSDVVNVDLVIEITDQLGQKLTKTITVKVKKPIL